jgi:glycosyltransferase involved in cell wall biosynthesis
LNSPSLLPASPPQSTGTTLGPDETSLLHHWMEFFRGGEAVLEQFGLLFPRAPISLLVFNSEFMPPSLRAHELRASFLQRVPWLRSHFRKLLPVFPEIIRRQRLAARTRFVLSSDASMIKGIPIPPGAVHVCYCHSPPRYLWGLEDSYLESSSHDNRLGRMIFSASLPHLRSFDQRVARRVDRFIANSQCVRDRIQRCYGRDAVVINPPVEVNRFDASRAREDFFLIVSALVPYKRVDLAVDACSKTGRPLVVIGTGPEEADLRRRAAPCVRFLGWQPNEVVRDHYERCRAFLFPGIEDFGITPCEAQAAGAPVVAFGEGGAVETVRAGVSGFFFTRQVVAAVIEALERFDAAPGLTAAACRRNVEHLGPARFRREIRLFLETEFPALFENHVWPEDVFNTHRPFP